MSVRGPGQVYKLPVYRSSLCGSTGDGCVYGYLQVGDL